MTRVLSVFTMLACLTAMLFACQPEPENVDTLIIGRWELERALRDGDPTNVLENLYFEFYKDGTMSTNLPVGAGTSSYEVVENTITQGGVENPLAYEVESISDSVMIFSTRLQDFHFVFKLRKAVLEN